MLNVPHALQPARAAPGTRLALHRRGARAQARRRQRDMPPHARSMWAAGGAVTRHGEGQ